MAVGTDQGLAGLAEPLQMDLMADTVAGPGEIHTVLGSNGLQVAVIVSVFKAALQSIVVNIGNGQLRLHPGDAHGLKFQVSHGARSILGQGLVDAQSHLAAPVHFPGHQVLCNDFFSNGHSHSLHAPNMCALALMMWSVASFLAFSASPAAMAS